jgi:stage II sporulation protein M
MKNAAMRLYMKEHLALYVFVSVLFVIGVVFGAVMVNALSLDQKQEMTRHLESFFQTVNDGSLLDGQQPQSFQQAFGLHVKWVLLLWILGLSVVGLPLILILDFLKGVLIGFTVGYLAGQFSWKGMLFALVSVTPQNLIVIPALLVCSVSGMAFSIYLVKNRLIQRKGAITQPFLRYSGTVLFMAVLLLGVSFYEGYVSPYLMKWVTPMLLAM